MSTSGKLKELNNHSLNLLLKDCKEFERQECFKMLSSNKDILK